VSPESKIEYDLQREARGETVSLPAIARFAGSFVTAQTLEDPGARVPTIGPTPIATTSSGDRGSVLGLSKS